MPDQSPLPKITLNLSSHDRGVIEDWVAAVSRLPNARFRLNVAESVARDVIAGTLTFTPPEAPDLIVLPAVGTQDTDATAKTLGRAGMIPVVNPDDSEAPDA